MTEEGSYCTNSEFEAEQIQKAFGRFGEYKEKAELLDWVLANNIQAKPNTDGAGTWSILTNDNRGLAYGKCGVTALREAKAVWEATDAQDDE